jgi:dipeptidyl-peptidase-4
MKSIYEYFLLFFTLCLCPILSFGQNLTIEDLFSSTKYREKLPDNLRFLKDDRFFTEQDGNRLLKKATLTGNTIDTLIDKTDTLLGGRFDFFDYAFSPDEKTILLIGNRQAIYRRSFTADYVIFQKDNTHPFLKKTVLKNVSNATFSPDGKKIAYTKNNNLFSFDIEKGLLTQITFDGKKNEVINGSTDWVYEEEFEFTKAYSWSHDSRYLAYYRFDESEVPEYNMQKWESLYPTDYRYKYPKAGEKNAQVEIKSYDFQQNQSKTLYQQNDTTYYLPHVQWDENGLQVLALDRSQRTVSIGTQRKRFSTSVEMEDYSFFLPHLLVGENGSFQLFQPEKPVLNALENKQLDKDIRLKQKAGDWIYFTQTQNAIETVCYRLHYKTGKIEKLSVEDGQNSLQVSATGNFYILSNSAAGRPPTVTLYDAKTKKPIRTLEDNLKLRQELQSLVLPKQKFFQFTTSENVVLNGWMIKPKNFNSTAQYPVIMFEYGGPGSQMVRNGWMGNTYLWHQLLANEGFVVACVDGRGTGGRGTAFRTTTYYRLGQLETQDQIEAAKYLATLPFVDKNRIGIWGWSYGGYLSTLSILLGNEVFRSAIAVAPVTSWRFYDTIYTERYLSTPTDNAQGYDLYSPIFYADRLKGNFLLVHGTADDNVHLQHSIALEEALIKSGKQFDMFHYPNKAHGISGDKTRTHLYHLMLDFWNKTLKTP